MQSVRLPREVQHLLASSGRHDGGFDGPYCWLFNRSQLAVWHPDNPNSTIIRELPYAAAGVPHLAAVVAPHGVSRMAPLAVVLASQDGNIALWTTSSEPHTVRLGGDTCVRALEVAPTSAGSLLAAVATDNGCVHLLRGYQGLEPALSQIGQEGTGLQSASSVGSGSALFPPGQQQQATPSVLARLAGLVQRAPQPSPSPLLQPSNEPTAALALLLSEASSRGGSGSPLQLLVCRRTAVECWDCARDEGCCLLWTAPVAQVRGWIQRMHVRIISHLAFLTTTLRVLTAHFAGADATAGRGRDAPA